MEVQAFLQSGGTLADLESRFAIRAKEHREHPNLVLLKYNQIASPFGERIVQECRGLILDRDDDWRVVCRPFDKFFNHGEPHAHDIDWTSAVVLEKLDGSLMTLYAYDGRWQVSTSGTPDGAAPVGLDGTLTFRDLFWEIFERCGYALPDDPRLSVMTELMTPANRVVVQHRDPRIVVIGARDRDTGAEVAVHGRGQLYGIPVVRHFPLAGIQDVLATFAAMSPLEQEGYVILDGRFRRLKVKHPGYVALHSMTSNLSVRALVEVVRANEQDEVLSAFPEWRPPLDEIRRRLDAVVEGLEEAYARIRSIESQKEFAAAAKQCPGGGHALFAVRSGKVASVRAFYAEVLHVNAVIRQLALDDRLLAGIERGGEPEPGRTRQDDERSG